MNAHDKYIKWAESRGISSGKVRARQMPERGGCGMVALGKIEVSNHFCEMENKTKPGRRKTGRNKNLKLVQVKAQEVILTVPAAAMCTLDTVPGWIRHKLRRPGVSVSVHGVLAAQVLLDATGWLGAWKAVAPRREDMWLRMPAAWGAGMAAHMPARARALAMAQRVRRERDWDAVSAAFPRVQADEYAYCWLLVATRAVYHASAATRVLAAPERVALAPLVDLFNHADGAGACRVGVAAGGGGGVVVTADRDYAPGEELRVCYGRHSSDVLLVEYGFVPSAQLLG